MNTMLCSYLEFMDFIDNIVQKICMILAICMTLSVLIQVFSRWLPIPTPPWTEELARYLMIYMAFVGSSCGIKRWDNISVDFIITRLPKKGQFVLDITIKIIVLAIIICFGYLAIDILPTVGLRQHSATLGIPMIIPQSSIIVGCVLMTLQLMGVIIQNFYNKEKNNV